MIFLVAPIAYPLLYGAIYLNKVETDVPIGVIDLDNSSLSRQLIRGIDAHQNIKVAESLYDEAQAREYMAHEKVQGVLFIPKGFETNLKYGKQVKINLMISPGRLLVLSDIGIPVSQVTTYFSAQVTSSVLMKKQVPVLQNKDLAQPIKFDFRNLYNPYLTYGDLILPALMIIILGQVTLIGVATATAKEWQMNKWKDLFSTTTNPLAMLIGKIIAYMLLFSVFATITYTIIAPMYGINFLGTYWDYIRITALGIAAISAMGLFIGTFFHHRITVFMIIAFTTYPFFMMSGYAWPTPQLPEYIVWFSKMIPLTSCLHLIFDVTQTGGNFVSSQVNIWFLLGLLGFYSILFMLRVWRIKYWKPRNSKIGKYIQQMPR